MGALGSRIRAFFGKPKFTHFGERQIVRHLLPILSGRQGFGQAFPLLGLPPAPSRAGNHTRGANWHALGSPEIVVFVRGFYAQDYPLLANLMPGCARQEPPLYAPPLSARWA